MNIQRKFLLFLFGTGLLSIIALGAVSLHGIYSVREKVLENGNLAGDAFEDIAVAMTASQTRKMLMEDVQGKAWQVERRLAFIRDKSQYLANRMECILADSERYPYRKLPVPEERRIASGEAYLHVSRQIKEGWTGDAAWRDAGLAANIGDDLELISQFLYGYNVSSYIGSKYGYKISSDIVSSEEMYEKIHSEENENFYDPRARAWYQLAQQAGKAVFTDVYTGIDGYDEITCAVPYYDRDGLAGVAGIDLHLDSLYELVSENTLGTDNIFFALNHKGEIVFSSADSGALAVGDGHRLLKYATAQSLAAAAEQMMAGEEALTQVTVDGREYYLAYAPMPTLGWSFGTLLKKEMVIGKVDITRNKMRENAEDFMSRMRSDFLADLWGMALLLCLVFFLLYKGSRLAAARFVTPIQALTAEVRDIAKGDLDRKLDIKTGDEIEELSDSVNHMTRELKEYMANLARVTEEKQKIASELSLAQDIQKDMLPNIFPKFANNPHYDLFATMHAAKAIGGDFYDFYNLDENHVVLTIADVTGKGVPASLFMVISKTILKNAALAATMTTAPESVDWAGIMEQTNRQLCENNEENMFVTIFFGVLNIQTGEFIYVNGGHKAPLIGRISEGRFQWQYILDEKRTHIVGVIEDGKYTQKRLTLKPGEMLYLYTNGVTEAMNERGRLYTKERLQATLCRVATRDMKMKDLLADIRQDLDAYEKGAAQSDDVAMLGLRYIG